MKEKMYDLGWIILLMIDWIGGQLINQPNLCASATWDPIGLTFADQSTIGYYPTTVLIDVNNAVYVVETDTSQVRIWNAGDVSPTTTISSGLIHPYGLFISNNSDIYIDNGASAGRVEKWTWSGTTGVPVMNVTGSCYSLFIDINNTLYCALNSLHQVVKESLNNVGSLPTVVVGNGTPGSASNMLNDPHGIFVDSNFNLYVADSGNNRIQLFQLGQPNGITVAGTGSSVMITLNYPTAVILDANGNLFIADTNNDRIVRTDSSGFRCVLGCSGSSGAAADQLNKPWSLSFGSSGNLFVTDQNNTRIQKFLLATNSCGPAYNQPNFCPTATWDPNAVTFADSTVVGLSPYGLFVSVNNTVYVAATNLNQVEVWLQGSSTPTSIIPVGFSSSYAIFASIIGNIYIDSGGANQVNKLTTNSSVEMYVGGQCFGLFIDINDVLYCSLGLQHQVLKKTLSNDPNSSIIIAGTGTSGSASNMLNQPRGIFLDLKFNLYVADCLNNRVQRFPPGQLNAVTIVGNGASGTITLNCPTGLALDGNGFLFITDFNNHRIIGSGASGYRCLVGCTGVSGSASNQLNNPSSLSFDSNGNLFVADLNNNRIQQFLLATNSCGPSYNRPKFCPSATWNPSAVNFADITTVGIQPLSVFVDTNNSVYVADKTTNNIQIWLKGVSPPNMALLINLILPSSVFVTIDGNIYADNGALRGRIDQWIPSTATSTISMYVSGICYGIFVDFYNNVFCSLGDLHQIVRRLSNESTNTSTMVAGTGVSGSASNMLNTPRGIFVSTQFFLYVADSGNNRIQLFLPKQLNESTVAGSGAPNTITLNYPTGVILDNQGYLFIVDTNNNRIIGSSANGFRCIVGCSTGSGSGANQLNSPGSLSFDSFGNLFVADTNNNRIQKFTLAINSCGRSYNLPQFCTYAAWNPNGITFADNTTVGSYPSDIFINVNNTIYVAATDLNQAQVWFQGATSPTITISAGLISPYAIFTSIINNIYIDNGASNNRVDKWMTNGTIDVVEMYSNASCYDLFTDTYDNLYCSINALHVVIKKSFDDPPSTSAIVAGTSTNGSGSYMLNGPRGIFVDSIFNLYVADCGNNRIQMFRLGQLNGTTVMKNILGGTIMLSCPTAVVLDATGYLFVTDYDNHRIIATGPSGFRCIVGCSGSGGSAADQLYHPRSISFDSYGNLYVTDIGNQRIQMFALATNSCYTMTTAQTMVTSTMSTEISTMDTQSVTLTLATSAMTISNQSSFFVPPTCPIATLVGPSCNISISPCDTIDPCQNDGTCFGDNTTSLGYICLCPSGVDGTDCQNDYRLCQSDTCWNNGSCLETSNSTYLCTCAAGWQNNNCELLINYCRNVPCLNKGVCRPLLLDFKCECLGDSYSGQFCEITSNRILTLQAVSKSLAFIAILAMVLVAAFIIIMDILTYCFGIDLTKAERELMRQKNYINKKKPAVSKQQHSLAASSIGLSHRSIFLVEEII